jgi:Rod binding domain-containing protein
MWSGATHQKGAAMDLPPPTLPTLPKTGARDDATLRQAARRLEAAFLSEMMRHAGLGTPRDAFGGGIGEAQFASFLRDTQARAMADSGGIGLAESIFRALRDRADG